MALLPVAEALRQVLAGAAPLPAERVPLNDAFGRVLAEDLVALRTQPPDAVSAMDGYAVRGSDVAKGGATLKVIGEVAAGHPFAGEIRAGEAARIFTGGVLPPGSDTVVIQEKAVRSGDTVEMSEATATGRNVRVKALDFSEGQTLLTKGQRLSGRDLMLAAAMNHPTVPVHRRPKVAVLATGDELVAPGSVLKPGQIVYSNGFALIALVRSEGAEAIDLGVAGDSMDELVAAVRRAREAGADVLLTSGGASVGDHDLVHKALAAEGLSLSFWRIALRPGKPMLHGRLGGMSVLGVPGNPVSSFVCSFLFLVPLLRTLSGRQDVERTSEWALLGRDMPANDERADYLRATLTADADGQPVATPFPIQDSSMMTPLAGSQCLILRQPHDPAAVAGSRIAILKLGL